MKHTCCINKRKRDERGGTSIMKTLATCSVYHGRERRGEKRRGRIERGEREWEREKEERVVHLGKNMCHLHHHNYADWVWEGKGGKKRGKGRETHKITTFRAEDNNTLERSRRHADTPQAARRARTEVW
jgi:hypothetical protein